VCFDKCIYIIESHELALALSPASSDLVHTDGCRRIVLTRVEEPRANQVAREADEPEPQPEPEPEVRKKEIATTTENLGIR